MHGYIHMFNRLCLAWLWYLDCMSLHFYSVTWAIFLLNLHFRWATTGYKSTLGCSISQPWEVKTTSAALISKTMFSSNQHFRFVKLLSKAQSPGKSYCLRHLWVPLLNNFCQPIQLHQFCLHWLVYPHVCHDCVVLPWAILLYQAEHEEFKQGAKSSCW